MTSSKQCSVASTAAQPPADITAGIAALAALVDQVDSSIFPTSLFERLGRILPIDLMAIFIYRGRSRPLCIFHNFPEPHAKRGIENYVQGTYVLNPFYRAHLDGLAEGVYRIRDFVAAGLPDNPNLRTQKVTVATSEEIGFVTHNWPMGLEAVVIAVPIDGTVTAELSIFRAERFGGFSEQELLSLNLLRPLVAALFRKYWQLSSHCFENEPLDARVDDFYDRLCFPEISPREREVAQLILRGHSSEAIGQILGISLTTVKTHRRRAYAKLEISSQSELLWLFLKVARQAVRNLD